jgi:hypothetical protein
MREVDTRKRHAGRGRGAELGMRFAELESVGKIQCSQYYSHRERVEIAVVSPPLTVCGGGLTDVYPPAVGIIGNRTRFPSGGTRTS